MKTAASHDAISFTGPRLEELLRTFATKRVLVAGDLILDEFIWGKVSRISPEAPVPVVEVASESYFPGGAANVARNLGHKVEQFTTATFDMKADIHPKYDETTIHCACGATYHTRSTRSDIKVGICAACHPFFTGEQKFVDTAGRIEKFSRRYSGVQTRAAKKKA